MRVNISQDMKDQVVMSLPLINNIQDDDLRNKVIDAWALSLSLNGYQRIEDIPGNGVPGGPEIGNQADHILGVARFSIAMVEILEDQYNESLNVDRDLLLAAALCHDLGKPYEYNPENQKRWNEDPRASGRPALRHTLYGVHIALTVGLPEAVAHACGCHSPEGEFVDRSLGTAIVHHADVSWWGILDIAHNWNLKIKRS